MDTLTGNRLASALMWIVAKVAGLFRRRNA